MQQRLTLRVPTLWILAAMGSKQLEIRVVGASITGTCRYLTLGQKVFTTSRETLMTVLMRWVKNGGSCWWPPCH